MSVVVVGIMAHPLIADYVEKDSRGRATGVQILAAFLGGFFSVVVLISIVSGFTLGAQF